MISGIIIHVHLNNESMNRTLTSIVLMCISQTHVQT